MYVWLSYCAHPHLYLLMPPGPIIGIATLFGLLSVITTTSTLCLLVCVVQLFKKNKSDKGTLYVLQGTFVFNNVF